MEIKKVIKTAKGTVKFRGEITDEEHEFILSVGLNTLLEAGALPFTQVDDEDDLAYIQPTDEDEVH